MLPGRLGFRKGQVFTLEVRPEGVLLIPLTADRFGIHGRLVRSKSGRLVWSGSVPETPAEVAIEQLRNERINEAIR